MPEEKTPAQKRQEAMRHHKLFTCPSWCAQPEDEDDHEEHLGEWRTVTTEDGDEVRVRPRISWWTDVDGDAHTQYAEVDIVREDSSAGAMLTLDLLAGMRELLDQAEADLIDAWDEEKWAYPGALDDAAELD